MTLPPLVNRAAYPPSFAVLLAWTVLTFVATLAGAVVLSGVLNAAASSDDLRSAPMAVRVGLGLFVAGFWGFMGVAGASILGRPPPRSGRRVLDRLQLAAVDGRPLWSVTVGVVGLGFCISAVLEQFGLKDVGALGEMRRVLSEARGLWWLAYASVLTFGAAFGEELFFRGLILRAIDASGTRTFALFASSALFALVHVDLVQGTAVLFIGLFLGWSVIRTGSLWTGIVGHAANNAAATLLLDAGLDWSPVVSCAVGLPMLGLGIAGLAGRSADGPSIW